nr:immunoglobulin light chain junction region [Macaca mulatta]
DYYCGFWDNSVKHYIF